MAQWYPTREILRFGQVWSQREDNEVPHKRHVYSVGVLIQTMTFNKREQLATVVGDVLSLVLCNGTCL